ncbi:hypothetical protein A6A19_07665 [Actinobacillus delphinicola]|uniref:hypothetical protein n=1 Tax=Actinobacillus delphinicola TaxID=51161 RepID=UPI0024420353|nr:hypothetical protein [Actinobacillus delphinicola]MDG6897851.1 hypothetical protein [Actinobacillus delphinicola]
MRIKTIIFASKINPYAINKTMRLKLEYKNAVKTIPLYKGVYSLDMELTQEVMLAIFIDTLELLEEMNFA